jgi:hypothetical protein
MGDTLTSSHIRLASFLVGNIGALPLRAVRYYAKHPDQIKAALERGFVFPPPGAFQNVKEKFRLLIDLGILTVPADYRHGSALADFRREFKKRSWSSSERFEETMIDARFPNPSHRLAAGKRYRIKAFGMAAGTTSDECFAFLAEQKAVLTGVQGLAFVFREKGSAFHYKEGKLPWEHAYLSFDFEERLPAVPELHINWKGENFVDLSSMDSLWGACNALLVFCPMKS